MRSFINRIAYGCTLHTGPYLEALLCLGDVKLTSLTLQF